MALSCLLVFALELSQPMPQLQVHSAIECNRCATAECSSATWHLGCSCPVRSHFVKSIGRLGVAIAFLGLAGNAGITSGTVTPTRSAEVQVGIPVVAGRPAAERVSQPAPDETDDLVDLYGNE